MHWLINHNVDYPCSCLLCPGCCFGCICHLFANNRFSSVIGAELNAAVAVPEFPVIDDSWRWSLSSSADSSFASSTDDSLHQLNNSSLSLDSSVAAASGPLLSTPLNSANPSCSSTADSRSLLAQHRRDVREKSRDKCTKRSRRVDNVTDDPSLSPSVSFVHKRRRLKRRWSQMLPSAGDDDECGVSPVQEQQKQNLSPSLTSNDDSCKELGEIHVKKRRRLKCSATRTLPFDSGDHTETAVHKRRRRSSTSKTSTPKARKKVTGDSTAISAQSQEQKGVKGRDVMAGDTQLSCTVAGNAVRTNGAVISSSASHPPELRLQNVATGKYYVLQPVVKVKVLNFTQMQHADNSFIFLLLLGVGFLPWEKVFLPGQWKQEAQLPLRKQGVSNVFLCS